MEQELRLGEDRPNSARETVGTIQKSKSIFLLVSEWESTCINRSNRFRQGETGRDATFLPTTPARIQPKAITLRQISIDCFFCSASELKVWTAIVAVKYPAATLPICMIKAAQKSQSGAKFFYLNNNCICAHLESCKCCLTHKQ